MISNAKGSQQGHKIQKGTERQLVKCLILLVVEKGFEPMTFGFRGHSTLESYYSKYLLADLIN